jgi:hypothetical protein
VVALAPGLRPSLALGDPDVRAIVRNFAPAFVSRGVMQLSSYVDSIVASLLPSGSVAVFGAATLVFGLSTHVVLSMVALAVTGAADMVSVVVRQTLVQMETPNEMRGRVSAVNSVFIGASNQLGEFESGATAAVMGPVGSVVLGGVGTLLIAAAWLRYFPDLARRDRL